MANKPDSIGDGSCALSSDDCGLIVDALRFYGRAYAPMARARALADKIATAPAGSGRRCRMCGAVIGVAIAGQPPHRCWDASESNEAVPGEDGGHGSVA